MLNLAAHTCIGGGVPRRASQDRSRRRANGRGRRTCCLRGGHDDDGHGGIESCGTPSTRPQPAYVAALDAIVGLVDAFLRLPMRRNTKQSGGAGGKGHSLQVQENMRVNPPRVPWCEGT